MIEHFDDEAVPGDENDYDDSDLESEAEIAELMQLDMAEDDACSGKLEYLAKYAVLAHQSQR